MPKKFFPLLPDSIYSPSSMTMVHGLKYRLPGRQTSGIREGFDYCRLYLDPIDIWNPQSMSISISFFYRGKALVQWQPAAHLHPGLRPVSIYTFSINLFTNHALSNHKLDSSEDSGLRFLNGLLPSSLSDPTSRSDES